MPMRIPIPWWFVKPEWFDRVNIGGQNDEIEYQKGMNILQRIFYHRKLKNEIKELEKQDQDYYERKQAELKKKLKKTDISDDEKTLIQDKKNKNAQEHEAEIAKLAAKKLAEKKRRKDGKKAEKARRRTRRGMTNAQRQAESMRFTENQAASQAAEHAVEQAAIQARRAAEEAIAEERRQTQRFTSIAVEELSRDPEYAQLPPAEQAARQAELVLRLRAVDLDYEQGRIQRQIQREIERNRVINRQAWITSHPRYPPNIPTYENATNPDVLPPEYIEIKPNSSSTYSSPVPRYVAPPPGELPPDFFPPPPFDPRDYEISVGGKRGRRKTRRFNKNRGRGLTLRKRKAIKTTKTTKRRR